MLAKVAKHNTNHVVCSARPHMRVADGAWIVLVIAIVRARGHCRWWTSLANVKANCNSQIKVSHVHAERWMAVVIRLVDCSVTIARPHARRDFCAKI